jgi:hypothetical protein
MLSMGCLYRGGRSDHHSESVCTGVHHTLQRLAISGASRVGKYSVASIQVNDLGYPNLKDGKVKLDGDNVVEFHKLHG